MLSSSGLVFEENTDLVCTNIFFSFGDLRQLAARFSNLKHLVLRECCFVPGDVASEISGFSKLQHCTIRGIDELPDEKDVELQQAANFENFFEGLAEACAIVQAERDSNVPHLRIELMNFGDTCFRERIPDLMDTVEAMLLGSGKKQSLAFSLLT